MKITLAALLAFTLSFATAAEAATVTPTSYNMRNGDLGFWDDSYSGRGNPERDNSRLRRGLGDLTDGIIATENWNVVEGAEDGPYVGWTNRTQRIVFRFDAIHFFRSATFHFDSSGGGSGANAPRRVIINGQRERVIAPGADPFAFTFDLSEVDPTDRLVIRIRRARSSELTFLSEVTFDAYIPPVPIPASGMMLLGAIAGFGLIRRRKSIG